MAAPATFHAERVERPSLAGYRLQNLDRGERLNAFSVKMADPAISHRGGATLAASVGRVERRGVVGTHVAAVKHTRETVSTRVWSFG